jgi:hypothetical protein
MQCCGAAVGKGKEVRGWRQKAECEMANDQWEMPNVKAQMPKGKMQITNDE